MQNTKLNKNGLLTSAAFAVPILAAAVMIEGWPLADNDMYLHITKGRAMWEAGSLLRNDIFSFTSGGQPDEIVHSWLSQLCFWFLYHTEGFAGLRILNFILTCSVLTLAGRFVWNRTKNPELSALAMSLVLLVHREIQVLRPLIFGELFFAILVFAVLDERKQLPPRRLGALLITALIWVNFHPGALICLPLLCCFNAAFLPEAWLDWKHKTPDSRKAMAWLVLGPLALALVLMLNPMGFWIYTYPLQVADIARRVGILEWLPRFPVYLQSQLNPPTQLLIDTNFRSIVYYLGLPFCLWATFKAPFERLSQRLYFSGLNLFFFLIAILAVRNTVYLIYTVACLTIVASKVLPRPQWRGFRLLATPTGLVVLSLITLFTFRFQESDLLVPGIEKAADFIVDSGLKGNLYNNGAYGSYLIFRVYPKMKVSCDGRIFVNRAQWEKETDYIKNFGLIPVQELMSQFPETDVIAVPSLVPLVKTLDPREWIVVFENDQLSVAIKRNERNRVNLQGVVDYYHRKGVSFDPVGGFNIATSLHSSPTWFASMQDQMVWGRWFDSRMLADWYRGINNYYIARELAYRMEPK